MKSNKKSVKHNSKSKGYEVFSYPQREIITGETISSILEENRIMGIISLSSGGFIVKDGCEYRHAILLTSEQLETLGLELIAMAWKDKKKKLT